MSCCKVCGNFFGSSKEEDLCITCQRALERLKGYAVPMVRCRECLHHTHDDVFGTRICKRSKLRVKEDDFCSYAKRNEGEEWF